MHTPRVARRSVIGAVFAAIVLASSPAAAGCGTVVPGSARPHGWSLSRMTAALAQFSTSGNDPAFAPSTPFQVLYAAPGSFVTVPDGCGLDQSGSNTFTVDAGRQYFVPVQNIDDSPPVIGTFPTTHAGAVQYFFDPAQIGGHDFAITIDGHRAALGADHLAGPVATPPLPDGGGTHIITLGTFLAPMRPGTHTISLSGVISGAALQPAFGVCSVAIDFVYTVHVRR
jgi:hypothetical protein